MSTTAPIPDDVARLVYGSVDDLKSMLPHVADAALVERAIAAAKTLREGKTKQAMLYRHLARLLKAKQAT